MCVQHIAHKRRASVRKCLHKDFNFSSCRSTVKNTYAYMRRSCLESRQQPKNTRVPKVQTCHSNPSVTVSTPPKFCDHSPLHLSQGYWGKDSANLPSAPSAQRPILQQQLQTTGIPPTRSTYQMPESRFT